MIPQKIPHHTATHILFFRQMLNRHTALPVEAAMVTKKEIIHLMADESNNEVKIEEQLTCTRCELNKQ